MKQDIRPAPASTPPPAPRRAPAATAPSAPLLADTGPVCLGRRALRHERRPPVGQGLHRRRRTRASTPPPGRSAPVSRAPAHVTYPPAICPSSRSRDLESRPRRPRPSAAAVPWVLECPALGAVPWVQRPLPTVSDASRLGPWPPKPARARARALATQGSRLRSWHGVRRGARGMEGQGGRQGGTPCPGARVCLGRRALRHERRPPVAQDPTGGRPVAPRPDPTQGPTRRRA